MSRTNACNIVCRNGPQCRHDLALAFERSSVGGTSRQPLLQLHLLSRGQALFPTSVPVSCGYIHRVLLAEELFKLARLRSLVEGGWGRASG